MTGRPRKKLKPLSTRQKYKIRDVILDQIHFDSEFNCRGDFTFESCGELAESIRQHGLGVPIIVWPKPELPAGKKYLLVAGHRRYRAFQILKIDKIPAMIRSDLTEREARLLNLSENLIRTDLNIRQEAQALKKLYPTLDGVSLRSISREVNQSVRWIQARFRLLSLPDQVQDMLATGRVHRQAVDGLFQLHNQRGDEACIEAALKIEKAKKNPVGVRNSDLPEFARKRAPKRTEVIEMIATMLDANIIGIGPRMGAYCAGLISKDELIRDIKELASKNRSGT